MNTQSSTALLYSTRVFLPLRPPRSLYVPFSLLSLFATHHHPYVCPATLTLTPPLFLLPLHPLPPCQAHVFSPPSHSSHPWGHHWDCAFVLLPILEANVWLIAISCCYVFLFVCRTTWNFFNVTRSIQETNRQNVVFTSVVKQLEENNAFILYQYS